MGSYEIAIDKRDGTIKVDGTGFRGKQCLELLAKLKLGVIIEEHSKPSEPHRVVDSLLNYAGFAEAE